MNSVEYNASEPSDHIRGHAITRMLVDSLFGTVNYDLSFPPGNPSVSLLFGENGSGKTTLLRAAYSLLYPSPTIQKRALLRTPFLFIGIELQNGARYGVRKDDPHDDQSLIFYFRNPAGRDFITTLKLGTDNRVIPSEDEKYIREMRSQLREASQGLYFLSYTRKLETTTPLLGDPYMERTRLRRLGYNIDLNTDKPDPDAELLLSIGRLHTQMQAQATKASNAGNARANEIYTGIIRDLARSSSTEPIEANAINALRDRIVEQSALRNAYANSGLTKPQEDSVLLQILSSVTPNNAAVAEVTSAYVRTEDARLAALGKVHSQITEFVDALKSFFATKKSAFDLASGLSLADSYGRPLDPRALSSGEKQLLLLLATVYAIDDQPNIFFIDEPELSLNVNWQRLLIRHLLLAVHDKPVQFVIATHSMDILSQNSQQTVELQPIEKTEAFMDSVSRFLQTNILPLGLA